MGNIKVLVVEDKGLIAQDIAMRLEKHNMEVVAICDSGEAAVDAARNRRPDLVLMDIQLSGVMDGIAAAQAILQQYDLPVIYLSDFTDTKTLERAKGTFPANYLAKPFQESDLIRAIDLAFSNANARRREERNVIRDSIFLRVDSQVFVKLFFTEILALEADRSYCTVITDQRRYTLSNNMSHIHDQLDHGDFIRAHRSYIVNVSRITAIDGNMLKLGTLEVQMGKEYRENLLQALKMVR